jgi:4-amino-4-deoxy-L-arabinose transferase-like glycosyltransferase
MALLIPFLVTLFTYWLLSFRYGRSMALGLAMVWVCTYLVVLTEVLSLFGQLSHEGILAGWSIPLLVLLPFCVRRYRRQHKRLSQLFISILPAYWLVPVLVLTGSLVTVVLAYPNNWDSMTYHLSRVMYWLQHGSVDHYATNNIRQISQPPLAEYGIAHLLALGHSDRWANLVQWIALLVSVSAVWTLAGQAGLKGKARIWPVLMVVTIPMAILQSNSTQNDLVAGASLLLFVTLLYRLAYGKGDRLILVSTGLAAGLALFSKGTNYIYILPVVVFFGVIFLRRSPKTIPGLLLAGLLGVGLINGLHWERNLATFGDLTGRDQSLQNEWYGIRPTLANTVKNTAMEAGTPSVAVNNLLTMVANGIHGLMGMDVHDPRINWGPSPPFKVEMYTTHEDYAGAPVHLLLALLLVLLLLFRKVKTDRRGLLFLGLGLCMWLLFATMLKWQIWHNRLHLPVWLILSSGMGILISGMTISFRRIVLVCLLLTAIPCVVFNASRPWFGEKSLFTTYSFEQYFANNEDLLPAFLQISGVLDREGVTRLALATSGDAWEYPFRVILPENDIEYRHIMVNNSSARYTMKDWHPEAIVSNRELELDNGSLDYNGRTYYQAYTRGEWTCLLPVSH